MLGQEPLAIPTILLSAVRWLQTLIVVRQCQQFPQLLKILLTKAMS